MKIIYSICRNKTHLMSNYGQKFQHLPAMTDDRPRYYNLIILSVRLCHFLPARLLL